MHGDRGGSLTFGFAHIGQSGAHNAQVIDAIVLKKARVFYGQNRVFHHLGNFRNRGECPVLLAKFTQQIALDREHAQR